MGNIVLAEMKRRFQIEFLKTRGLRPEHMMLDLGCGTLRGGIAFIGYLKEGNYCGIEVRENVLAEARKELVEHDLEGKKPLLLTPQDAASALNDVSFDYIWAFSVLIHMSDDILRSNLEFVSRHLANQGTFYANVNIGTEIDKKWQGFPVVTRSDDFYKMEAAKCSLEVKTIGTLADLGHNTGLSEQDRQVMLEFRKS